MIEVYYGFLSAIFAPILVFPAVIAELFLAVLITFVITLFYKFLVDQNKMKSMKDEMKEMQKKIKEAQKTNPEQANKMMGDVLKLTNKQMFLNFKPMIPTMIFVFALLPWMASVFTGPIVLLPFSLPFFGNDFGWLMWYIILSMPLTIFFRKILGVV